MVSLLVLTMFNHISISLVNWIDRKCRLLWASMCAQEIWAGSATKIPKHAHTICKQRHLRCLHCHITRNANQSVGMLTFPHRISEWPETLPTTTRPNVIFHLWSIVTHLRPFVCSPAPQQNVMSAIATTRVNCGPTGSNNDECVVTHHRAPACSTMNQREAEKNMVLPNIICVQILKCRLVVSTRLIFCLFICLLFRLISGAIALCVAIV